MRDLHPGIPNSKHIDGDFICDCHGKGFSTRKRMKDHEYKIKQKLDKLQ